MKNKIILFISIVFLLVGTSNAQTGKPQYTIRTEQNGVDIGTFTIELFPMIAPLHSAYFDSLVNINFFDSTAFHRVVPDFVIQGGDPNSKYLPRETWGEGDPNQATILAEFSGVSHQRGIIGAARDEDINSASSQFYVNLTHNDFLDSNYTAFGRVISGMEICDSIVSVPRDANDNPIDKIMMFVRKGGLTNNIPTIPDLTFPKDLGIGVVVGDTLRWDADDDAVEFTLQISKTESFDSLYLNTKVGFPYYRLSFLELGNVEYYWRVAANNGGNISEFSAPKKFYSSIKAPILLSPAMNEDSVSVNAKLEWTAVSGATKYKLQVSIAPQFKEQYLVIDTDTITTNSFVTPELQQKKSHYWRVYSATDEYLGPKSNFSRFVTGAITSIASKNNLPSTFSLSQNFPNPFNPSTTIKYSIPSIVGNGHAHSTTNVTLIIYDILGQEVVTLVNKEQSPGRYEVTFDASNLTSGMYIYRIQAGGYIQSKKLLLLK